MYIPIIKDAASASAALQKGDINWQTEVTSDALRSVKDDPNLQVAEYADFGYYFIAFNLREGKLYNDINLRKAFSMCIDHDATVQAATEGNGVPVYANTPPASWAFNPDIPKYTLDVAGAKQLIEGSGWTLGSDGVYAKDGKRLSTDLYVRQGRPQRVAFGSLAKDQLEGMRHRDQRQGIRFRDGAPAAPQLPQQLRHLPRRLVDLYRPRRLLDLPAPTAAPPRRGRTATTSPAGEQGSRHASRAGPATNSTRPSARTSTRSSRCSSTTSSRTTSCGATSGTPR